LFSGAAGLGSVPAAVRALGVTCEAFAGCEDIAGDAQAPTPPAKAKRARNRNT
jgi:hypothetical protein